MCYCPLPFIHHERHSIGTYGQSSQRGFSTASLLTPQCCEPMGSEHEVFFSCSILDRSNIICGQAGLYEPLFTKWFVSLFSCGNLSWLVVHQSAQVTEVLLIWELCDSSLVLFGPLLTGKSFYACGLQVVESQTLDPADTRKFAYVLFMKVLSPSKSYIKSKYQACWMNKKRKNNIQKVKCAFSVLPLRSWQKNPSSAGKNPTQLEAGVEKKKQETRKKHLVQHGYAISVQHLRLWTKPDESERCYNHPTQLRPCVMSKADRRAGK